MAGFWNLSNSQLHDLNGKPYPGAKAYFYAADSLTKITVYRDYGLGTAHPNPVEADGNGYFPAVFLDETDEFFRQRITTQGGSPIQGTDLPVLPIIGPSGGGGGSEVPVDANAIFKTGDTLWLDVTGTRDGWVRDNGRTIGSATSGATERANSDCELLYLFGWAAGWSVVGGAGATAAADWAANKPITLPDKRGRGPMGVDDMGNTSASRLSGATFSTGDATTAGSVGGAATRQIQRTNLPNESLTTTIAAGQGAHTHGPGLGDLFYVFDTGAPNAAGPINSGGTASAGSIGLTASSTLPQMTGTTPMGSGTYFEIMQPFVLGTFYRKL